MARPAAKRSPARLVIALSVAAVLAVFLLYTSIAGGGTPMIQPSELAGRSDRVTLAGHVVGAPRGDAYADGLRFELRNIKDDDGTRVELTRSVAETVSVRADPSPPPRVALPKQLVFAAHRFGR